MFLAVVLTILGIGFICWLLFTLSVYALPFFAAVTTGLWAYGTGAGILGSAALGLLAGVATLSAGQMLFSMVRSTIVRLALALASPHRRRSPAITPSLSAVGVPSETWRQVFAVLGAMIVGCTAAARLTLVTDLGRTAPDLAKDRACRPQPDSRAAALAFAECGTHISSSRPMSAALLRLVQAPANRSAGVRIVAPQDGRTTLQP